MASKVASIKISTIHLLKSRVHWTSTGEACIAQPSLFMRMLKEVCPFCACCKTEGLQLSELFSSWLFF